ncbi:NUDIX hydrolase [Corallincola platygyrae]|uniref:NUDIX hydrolase n=1 Tax=Corallincola platygyrae TaxID=1193278 RepID=A0ABW4XMV4_9GAMM
MQLNTLLSRFHLHQSQASQAKGDETEAAVLVPLWQGEQHLEMFFMRRPREAKHHPDQICFPGGKREARDIDLMETAIRETEEEFGLSREDLSIIGSLPALKTRTGFYVQPYLAILNTISMNPDQREVADLFSLPVHEVLSADRYRAEQINLQGRHIEVFGTQSSKGLIWGMTAQVLINLIGQLATEQTKTSS